MSVSPLIFPVLTMVGWTFVMWVWMYATRIPAMRKANIDVDEVSRTGAKLDLPPEVARVADNYNHLHEQPTIFYATALAGALLDIAETMPIVLAWTYVALRIVHSLVQATRNVIMVRFSLFALGSVALFLLFVQVLLAALAA